MKIEVLGTGCAKCKALYESVKQATAKIGGFYDIVKVEDITKIMEYQVMSMPSLVINGVVRSSGKVLNIQDIINLINQEQENKDV